MVVVNSGWSRPMRWVLMWKATAWSPSSSTPKVYFPSRGFGVREPLRDAILGHELVGAMTDPYGHGIQINPRKATTPKADRTFDVAYARVSSSTGMVRMPAVCRS